MFSIQISSQGKKFLKNADKILQSRLKKKILELGNEPFPADSKRLNKFKDKVFRVRVGSYRIQYAVYFNENTLLIASIDKRSRAYQ